MSASYVPCKGDFFYTRCRPWDHVVGDHFGGTATIVKQQDNSYSEEVMECMARDDHMVVARRRIGYRAGSDLMLPRHKWDFFPVGPEVLRLLALTNEGEQP